MKVKELIEKLKEMDQEATVVVWDCSWEGQIEEVERVYRRDEDGAVHIE